MSGTDKTERELPPLVVNTADFNNQDFQDFVDISEEIVRTSAQRHSQRKSPKSAVTMIREEIFESIKLDDDHQQKDAEHKTNHETETEQSNLLRSIENLLKCFDDDVKIRPESVFENPPVRTSARSKVATIMASLRSKCGLPASPLIKRKKLTNVVKNTKTQNLKQPNKISMKSTKAPSPKAMEKTKSFQVQRKSKLKHQVNKTSSAKTPTTESPRSISSTKTTKVKPKFICYKTKLPTAKSSPLFKKKIPRKTAQAERSAENNHYDHLEKQHSIICLVEEAVLPHLSVKDKTLLYNKFIEHRTDKNAKSIKEAEQSGVQKLLQQGEVVFEKQNSVKELRAWLEAKLTPNKLLTTNQNRSASKSILDSGYKSKEEDEDILQPSYLQDKPPIDVHVNNWTMILKSPHEQKQQVDDNFLENDSNVEPFLKTTQNVIRFPFRVPLLVSPTWALPLHQELLSPKLVSQIKLLYHGLNNKENNLELMPENATKPRLLIQDVPEILEAVTHRMESSSNGKFEIEDNQIKQKKKDKEIHPEQLAVTVIEQLPSLRDEKEDAKYIPTEYSDLGLTNIKTTSSEDSQTELNSLNTCGFIVKPIRKKKLRRNFMQNPEISSTDSDSDTKTQTAKPSHCIKKMLVNNHKRCRADKSHTDQLSGYSILDESFIRQMNSPSKVKTAYTLTVLSSPSPQPESDCYETDLANTHVKGLHHSCPSNLHTAIDSSIRLLKNKAASEELIDLVQPKTLYEQKILLTKRFTDRRFNTKYNKHKSANNAENYSTSCKLAAHQEPFTNLSDRDKMKAAVTNRNQDKDVQLAKASKFFKAHKLAVLELEENSTTGSLNESSRSHQSAIQTSSNSNQTATETLAASQFWISSGYFTAALNIHYCEPDGLMLLSNVFAQKSLETREMDFGIDAKKFSLHSRSTSVEIVQLLPQKVNCSQYWFFSGDVFMPFEGPQMTANKIEKFFNYIREFMKETEFLRFGIDSYEFSSWALNSSSPLRTSDLDQSDLDSEEYEQSLTFAGCR